MKLKSPLALIILSQNIKDSGRKEKNPTAMTPYKHSCRRGVNPGVIESTVLLQIQVNDVMNSGFFKAQNSVV